MTDGLRHLEDPHVGDVLPELSGDGKGTVRLQTNGYPLCRADSYDILPIGYITFAIGIAPDSYYGAVRFQAQCVRRARSNGDNIRSAACIALPMGIVACNNHRAIGFQPYGIHGAGVNRNNILPSGDITFACICVGIAAGCYDCAICH